MLRFTDLNNRVVTIVDVHAIEAVSDESSFLTIFMTSGKAFRIGTRLDTFLSVLAQYKAGADSDGFGSRTIYTFDGEAIAFGAVGSLASVDDESDPEAADALDAARYRWLRADHAYTPEEEMVRGGEDLDKLCDAGIIEVNSAPAADPIT